MAGDTGQPLDTVRRVADDLLVIAEFLEKRISKTRYVVAALRGHNHALRTALEGLGAPMDLATQQRIGRQVADWLREQKYGDEELLHSAVCCDLVGRINFDRALGRQISEALSPDPQPGAEEWRDHYTYKEGRVECIHCGMSLGAGHAPDCTESREGEGGEVGKHQWSDHHGVYACINCGVHASGTNTYGICPPRRE